MNFVINATLRCGSRVGPRLESCFRNVSMSARNDEHCPLTRAEVESVNGAGSKGCSETASAHGPLHVG
jgi:hypothetical protein